VGFEGAKKMRRHQGGDVAAKIRPNSGGVSWPVFLVETSTLAPSLGDRDTMNAALAQLIILQRSYAVLE